MAVTIEPYPTSCPHGTRQGRNSTWASYADGCWTTSRGEGVRSIFHLDDTGFRSVTLADYLAAWDEALVLNAGDELYDEAVEMNERCQFRGLISVDRPSGGLTMRLDETTVKPRFDEDGAVFRWSVKHGSRWFAVVRSARDDEWETYDAEGVIEKGLTGPDSAPCLDVSGDLSGSLEYIDSLFH